MLKITNISLRRLRRNPLMLILILTFLLLSFLSHPDEEENQQAMSNSGSKEELHTESTESASSQVKARALVTRIVDGDTIEISGGLKVRYIGIDTPEDGSQKECFGREASLKNAELVLGKEVFLEKDVSETDRYGRLLRYVWVEETLINRSLVEEGFASAISYPPDVKYQEILRTAELSAREKEKGLWGPVCRPIDSR